MSAEKCAAMDWKLTKGGKDYVECSAGATHVIRLEGTFLAVTVRMCEAHQRYFINGSRTEHWTVVDAETGHEVRFWQGKRELRSKGQHYAKDPLCCGGGC